MAAPTNRMLTLNTDLGAGSLYLTRIEGHEGLSELFNYQIEFVTQQPLTNVNSIIGQDVSFTISQQNEPLRQFNGILTELCQASDPNFIGWYGYQATVRPWLWLLTQQINCCIYPDCSATQRNPVDLVTLLQAVLDRYTPYQTDYSNLTGNYPQREFCVQYNETDYNFLTRLLEEHGIFYFFQHTADQHTLILADQASAYGQTTVTPYSLGMLSTDELQIWNWRHKYSYIPQGYSLNSHDYQNPTLKLLGQATSTIALSSAFSAQRQIYSARHLTRDDGTTYAGHAIGGEEARYSVVEAESNMRALSTGDTVSLQEGLCSEESIRAFTVTAMSFKALDSNLPGMTVAPPSYCNKFSAIPQQQLFCPVKKAIKPLSYELHEAVVTGPAGEEIYTDPFGCHCIQFCWDTVGAYDGNSSCWVRYSAQTEGMLRVGTPVLVGFLQGDLDQPIILGPLYDGQQQPLFPEPTMSGLKRRPGINSDGSYYNELSFNDTQDNGMVLLNAFNNMQCTVGNDLTLEVTKGNDTLTIDQGNLVITINQGEYQLQVKGNISISTDADLSISANNITLNAQEKLTVSGGSVEISSSTGSVEISSSSSVDIEGNPINLNS